MATKIDYNVYDSNDNLVFVGNVDECIAFIGTSFGSLRRALNNCQSVKGYFVARSDIMEDYERHRRKKAMK